MKVSYRVARKKLSGWIREQLIGPGADENKSRWGADFSIKGMRPSEAFQSGVLFPISEEAVDRASEGDEPDLSDGHADGEDTQGDTAANRVRYVPPSSCGFSFYVEGVEGNEILLEIRCWAVRYESSGGHSKEQEMWTRRICAPKEDIPWRIPLSGGDDRQRPPLNFPVFTVNTDHRARLQAICRPHGIGSLVTLSLANVQKEPVIEESKAREGVRKREEQCLFECELECRITKGQVGDYPRAAMSLLSGEDQELAIQYRNKRVLAVGHGTGVAWNTDANGVTTVCTDFMPRVEVPSVTADTGEENDPTLNLDFLADIEVNPVAVTDSLTSFVKCYENWIAQQRADAATLAIDEQEAARRIVERMEQSKQRMLKGIAYLTGEGNGNVRRAFAVANQAMAQQMRQGLFVAGKPEKVPRWRPFQLGFLLMVLESAIDDDHIDRDLVDLIWFPTGGGKTEAYLALVAFLITWRRLKYRVSGGGTTILMRYTLRLLTGQQFERATRLIFAMEHLRRTQPEVGLGDEPISIGMWVGSATTPNKFDAERGTSALKEVIKSQQSGTVSRNLLLTQCPWCGRAFDPFGSFIATPNQFNFLCQNPQCAFHSGAEKTPLPCNVVDDALYAAPPTLLIGTIDKFARLAWEPRASAFFGGKDRRAPELIIQDELHLIAGPLGSIAGVYEAALDTVLVARGIHPKYIASTATIRNAQEQVGALYARNAAVFPPPGLDEGDSWFARAVPVSDETPGRLYLGYLAPARNKAKSIAPLAAALLAAPDSLIADDANRDALRDAWWTLVSYHSSLKGVGIAYSALDIDVPTYLNFLDQKRRHFDTALPPLPRRLESGDRLQQLSSVVDSVTNHRTFARLARRCDDTPSDYFDAIITTNIIATGVDIGRLATMIVNGQPLTTAEYIQASSRVGRGEVPGLVCVNYYRDQVRSLSHYENFRAYHESFYRHVEPTSVTPFTYPCRQRALHAALVIVMRYGAGLLDERAVERFDPKDERQSAIINKLIERCAKADPGRGNGLRAHMESLQQKWLDYVDENAAYGLPVKYSAPDSDGIGVARLIHDFDAENPGLWPTLQSMRNVEHTALVKLL
jgi:hypothetical protein